MRSRVPSAATGIRAVVATVLTLGVTGPLAGEAAAAPSFAAAGGFEVGGYPRQAAAADFNGDGDPDLAVASQTGNVVAVRFGGAGLSFSDGPRVLVGPEPVAVITPDVDGDGRPDIVSANSTGNSITVSSGGPDGSFGTPQDLAAGAAPNALAAGDFNGDGDVDLAVTNGTSADGSTAAGSVTVLQGGPGASFSTAQTVPAGLTPDAVVAADFNGDGDADLAVANQGSNTLSIQRGIDGATFAPVEDIPLDGRPRWVSPGDFNRDGRTDLAVAVLGGEAADRVTILLGNETGGFGVLASVPVGTLPAQLAVADLDFDGDEDVAAANFSSDSLSLLTGLPDGGRLSPASTAPVGAAPSGVTPLDADGDGALDLAVVLAGSGQVALLQNTTPKPLAPEPLLPPEPAPQPDAKAVRNGSGKATRALLEVGAARLVGKRVRGRTRTSATIPYASRAALLGRLRERTGKKRPITRARVLVEARIERGGATFVPLGVATTKKDGRFSVVLPSGPSRALRVRWFPTSKSTKPGAEDRARVRVQAGITIRVARQVRRGRSFRLSGGVRGKLLPRSGAFVEFQTNVRGAWRTFQVARTTKTGRFQARFSFPRGGPSVRYRIRARLRRQPAFPFVAGGSRSARVLVRAG